MQDKDEKRLTLEEVEASIEKKPSPKLTEKKKGKMAQVLAHLIAASAGIRKPQKMFGWQPPGKNHKAWPAKKRRRKIVEASKRRNRKVKV